MFALRAHVENGHIVADEPVDLPDGTLLRVTPADELERDARANDRGEIEQAIEQGYDDFEKGDHEDAKAFAARLLAKA